MPRIELTVLSGTLKKILLQNRFSDEDADISAGIFVENTASGVASHGVNRFPQFVSLVQKGHIIPGAKPSLVKAAGSIEQWDGNLGPGPLNALAMVDRAMILADQSGLGCVALRNTNHWMRGGTYGARAAACGYISICWTNTIPNLPPWGSRDAKTGNNPLVLAVPRRSEPVVLDMAMSQFSYGTLATFRREGRKLPVIGGYDTKGDLTDDPGEIYASFRPLPAGYWKGSGLSLLLDLIAAVLSGGKSTRELGTSDIEFGVSQVFLVLAPQKLTSGEAIESAVDAIVEHFRSGQPIDPGAPVRIPGERAGHERADAVRRGIVVDDGIWDRILRLQGASDVSSF
jgi:3-dehydro-L-gulonate 2-dehydrogenase